MRLLTLAVLASLLLSACAALPFSSSGVSMDPNLRLQYLTEPSVARIGCSASVRWRLSSTLRYRFATGSGEWRTELGSAGGSGFVVDPSGYIATNAHVVQLIRTTDHDLLEMAWPQLLGKLGQLARRRVTRDEVAAEIEPIVERTLTVTMPGGDSYPARVAKVGSSVTDGGLDVAILKVDASNLPFLPLGNSQLVSPPRSILVIGYPIAADTNVTDPSSRLAPTYFSGIVSARKTTRQGVPVFQISAQAFPGNSGGPVVLANQKDPEVVGILTFGAGDAESLNFVFPSEVILDFIKQANAQNIPGELDRAYADALDKLDTGDYAIAVADLNHVLTLYPSHAMARQLLATAQAYAAAPTPLRSWRLWAGGGLLAFALLGSVVVLLAGRQRRQRQRQAAPAPQRQRRVNDPEATQEIFGPPGALVGHGSLGGRRFPLTPAGLLVGRDATCNVVVNDPRVSKRHVWVGAAHSGRGVEAVDQGSRNGTFLVRRGGRPVRVDRTHLQPGDAILLVPDGTLAFTYEL